MKPIVLKLSPFTDDKLFQLFDLGHIITYKLHPYSRHVVYKVQCSWNYELCLVWFKIFLTTNVVLDENVFFCLVVLSCW